MKTVRFIDSIEPEERGKIRRSENSPEIEWDLHLCGFVGEKAEMNDPKKL